MELSKQVVSLELAKKLKELGFKQESLFYHNFKIEGKWVIDKGRGWSDSVSAYTVAELGEMLPQILKIKKVKYQLSSSVALDKQWFVVYVNEEDLEDNAPMPFMMCHNEADARAKMVIHLTKNKLLPPQK